ncbi:Flagellar biosynthesis protein, FliO [Terriglobus roseus DSM 18391]|uniref:Flagellar biosynthesis protein, FliO n=1 Tax=Terriglobus roseus (strain DSM 18391 / NRRL B-41598 / KBS 63) TaxID=926566 RepID=I3ZFW1_TERRK|nr:Flagellar biosynthesis protein, FliO [Terriglobus roseus DSM 18391]
MNVSTVSDGRSLMKLATSLRSKLAKSAAGLIGSRRPSGHSLQIRETLSLGIKRQVFLIECDGQRFLITAAGDSISSPVSLAIGSAARCEETPQL